ncbi:MAG TPA: hypothetical protein VHC39_11420 [Rhizomicrobium sp.]|nr:hypothetical protein [Rhizomicrobium sp.]
MRDPRRTYDQPLEINTMGDEVVIIGPGPVSIALTARAAAASVHRLLAAARKAKVAHTGSEVRLSDEALKS